MSLQRKEEIVENLTKVKNNMQDILDKQQRQVNCTTKNDWLAINTTLGMFSCCEQV